MSSDGTTLKSRAFAGVLAWSRDGFNLAPKGHPRYVDGLWVSGDFFEVLGVKPVLGRALTPADDERGAPATVVLSFGFWQHEFAGDSSIIGKTLTLDGHIAEVIGVAPRTFFGLEIGRSFDVAVPISCEPTLRGKGHRLDSGTTWWLNAMGRLKPGWSMTRASSQLGSISPGIFEATLPANYPSANVTNYLGFKLTALPAGTGLSTIREAYSRPLWLLLAIAGVVLLISCANLANLLLARASLRQREIVVRLALGASRYRLLRQLISESLLLALIGAGSGWLLAQGLSRFLVAFLTGFRRLRRRPSREAPPVHLRGRFVFAPANSLEADPAAGTGEAIAVCFASAVSSTPSLGKSFSEALPQPALACKVDSNSRNSRSASTLTSGLPRVSWELSGRKIQAGNEHTVPSGKRQSTRSPLRYVPLELPRSSTLMSSPSRISRQCLRDTSPSGILKSQSSRRPMTVTSREMGKLRRCPSARNMTITTPMPIASCFAGNYVLTQPNMAGRVT